MQKPLGNDIEVTSVAEEFNKWIKDEDWIPKQGAASGIFIKQDLKITTTRQQAALLEKHKLGSFFIKAQNDAVYVRE